MSNPWDDYKDTTHNTSGPWDDFAPTKEDTQVPPGVPGHEVDFQNPKSGPVYNGHWYDNVPFVKENMEAIKNIHNPLDYAKYVRDSNMASLKAAGHMATGLVDTLTPTSLWGGNEASTTNLLDNLTPAPTEQQQSLEGGLNDVISNLDPGLIHMAPMAKAGERNAIGRIKDYEPPKVEPIKAPTMPWEDFSRPADPLANQSDMPAGQGAFDNIRRQVAGTITDGHQDITNTPMERVTDTLLNGQDQAATAGAAGPDAYIATLKQKAIEAQQAHEAAIRQAAAQAALEARQTALEQAVRRQSGLDFNAAERARQEAAPTGAAEAMQAQADASRFQPTVEGLTTRDAIPENRVPQAPVDPMTSAMRNLEPVQRDSRAMAEATRGITYENVPPDGVIPRDSRNAGVTVPRGNTWHVDENGIPVRQGLPTSEPDLSPAATVHGILNQDTGARNDLGNAIQEANGPKLGPDEHFGAGPIDKLNTPSPAFNSLINDPFKGPGRRQAGTAPIINDLVTGISKGASAVGHAISATADLVRKTSAELEDLAAKPLKSLIGTLPEDHMARVSGIRDMVYKPESGDAIVAKGLAEGKKVTKLWPNVQSGMTLAGQKVGSSVLQGAARWLQWQDKKTHLENRTMVDPIQGKLKKMVSIEPGTYETLSKLMMREQGTRTLFSDKELSASLSPRGVEAYKALRKAYDDSLARSNATRQAAGKEPIKAETAYHASIRQGDYKQSFFDKEGKLLSHVSSTSRLDALKGQKYMKEKFRDKIDWEKSTIWNSSDVGTAHIPRDIITTYQEALKLIDPHNPVNTLISDSIQKANEDRGMGYAGYDERFLNKSNVPGFEGNKPWLSDRENAHAFFNAQLGYLRDTNRWNNFQEALNNLNPIMKNTDLLRNQPNIMKTVAAHVNRELGLTPSVFKEVEKIAAKMVPSFGSNGIAFGKSRGSLYSFTSSLKHATYLTQLGFNPALAITVPLQSALSVAQHRVLTTEGYTHNPLTTLVNTLADAGAGLARHTMTSMTGKEVDTPISPMGKRLLQYAEDNGILDKTVLDESGSLDNGGILSPVKRTLGATITAPEKLSRYTTFVGFAHHLMQSGKLSEVEAMQKAEEFTNNSLTSMRRSDRPIVVDKAGVLGQMAYTYKSFLFNEYNQLSQLGQLARKGTISPLATHLGTLFLLGGLVGMPLVNELDNGWEMIKNMVAKFAPEDYAGISGLGLKGSIMRDLPTWASLGPVSAISETNIGTRSSSQVADLMNPLGNIAAPIQELSELSSIGKAALHPTEQRGWENSVHVNVPPMFKSMMEAHLDDYKNPNNETADGRNPDGTMTYRKSTDVINPRADYNRTPHDEAVRKLGMYSSDEYRTKAIRYAKDKEQERVKTAYSAAISAAVSNFLDARQGKAGKLVVGQNYAAKALKLIPDAGKFNKALEEAALSSRATPEQLDLIHAQSIATLQKVKRAEGAD